jgi:glycerol-3-phosphate cytidylyltransferase
MSKTKAYLGGNFDLVHAGHIRLFQVAKRIADIVVVSLNTDAFSLQYKKKLPVMPLNERLEIVKACRYVDKVIVNEGGYDSKISIEKENPDFIIHGDDWVGDAFLEQLGVTKEWLIARNICVLYVPYQTGDYPISSTLIKERVKQA